MTSAEVSRSEKFKVATSTFNVVSLTFRVPTLEQGCKSKDTNFRVVTLATTSEQGLDIDIKSCDIVQTGKKQSRDIES